MDLWLCVGGLSHTVGGRRLFDSLGLTVDAGESVAITGPSGSGKSTLLSCLLGLIRPDHGTVEVAGVELTALRGSTLARHRSRYIGMVFQFGHGSARGGRPVGAAGRRPARMGLPDHAGPVGAPARGGPSGRGRPDRFPQPGPSYRAGGRPGRHVTRTRSDRAGRSRDAGPGRRGDRDRGSGCVLGLRCPAARHRIRRVRTGRPRPWTGAGARGGHGRDGGRRNLRRRRAVHPHGRKQSADGGTPATHALGCPVPGAPADRRARSSPVGRGNTRQRPHQLGRCGRYVGDAARRHRRTRCSARAAHEPGRTPIRPPRSPGGRTAHGHPPGPLGAHDGRPGDRARPARPNRRLAGPVRSGGKGRAGHGRAHRQQRPRRAAAYDHHTPADGGLRARAATDGRGGADDQCPGEVRRHVGRHLPGPHGAPTALS
ncbi:hypothetical protein CG740_18145 [Streptomyces sp. CB01201]|nr:hypothetical protein CG740_18145 [Streptomyces sp. CB01201]